MRFINYGFAILLATLAILLLPLVYFGTFSLLTSLTLNFILSTQSDLPSLVATSLKFFAILAYMSIATSFFKIFFPLKRKHPPQQEVSRADNPQLWKRIDSLSQELSSPCPRTLLLDNELNAFASLPNSIKGLFSRNFRLTIGKPLLEICSKEIADVILVHELAHFSQSLGMRISLIASQFDKSLSDLIHSRTQWDHWIREQYEKNTLTIRSLILAYLIFNRFAVRFALIIHLPFQIVRCFLLREMEYDADRKSVKMCGAKTFNAALLEISLLIFLQTQIQKSKQISSTHELVRPLRTARRQLTKTKIDKLHETLLKETSSPPTPYPTLSQRSQNIERSCP